MILGIEDDAREVTKDLALVTLSNSWGKYFCYAQKFLNCYQFKTLVVPYFKWLSKGPVECIREHVDKKVLLIIKLFPSCVDQVHVATNRSCSTLCGARDIVCRER